jgi:glycosyltransferase involved in cell wall biosynthesis
MKGHILVIADGRSPTARSWIANIQAIGYDVSLISTFACEPPPNLQEYHHFPVAFSRYSGGTNHSANQTSPKGIKSFVRRFSSLFQNLRYWVGPLTLPRYAPAFQTLVNQIQPDLIHALRIPFEGMLGSYSPQGFPFLAGTWGNDLTLHAKGSPLMRTFTRRCLRRADGLSSDTMRDVDLAKSWGLRSTSPTLVVPGSGGIDLESIQNSSGFSPAAYGIPADQPLIVNPRGIRPGSVHQDVFFAAIPNILEKQPECAFLCPGLAGVKQAEEWVAHYGIEYKVFLLPNLPQSELWSLFKTSQVFVSPSSHDGTPNSLLESMACGCFPVVGDIQSLREWVQEGENGFLIDPRDSDALAMAVLEALENRNLRKRASETNLMIIKQRAAQRVTRPKIEKFYSRFIK